MASNQGIMEQSEFMDIVRSYRTVWDRACTTFKDKNLKNNVLLIVKHVHLISYTITTRVADHYPLCLNA